MSRREPVLTRYDTTNKLSTVVIERDDYPMDVRSEYPLTPYTHGLSAGTIVLIAIAIVVLIAALTGATVAYVAKSDQYAGFSQAQQFELANKQLDLEAKQMEFSRDVDMTSASAWANAVGKFGNAGTLLIVLLIVAGFIIASVKGGADG